MDVQKQIRYWREGSDEDIDAARALLEKGHLRHALFFAELAVEKMLKALVVKTTKDHPPRIHNLLRLAELAKISLPEDREEFLSDFQSYCLEGRYPEHFPPPPSRQEAETGIKDAEEALSWLKKQL